MRALIGVVVRAKHVYTTREELIHTDHVATLKGNG
jgi:hypothetical protein